MLFKANDVYLLGPMSKMDYNANKINCRPPR